MDYKKLELKIGLEIHQQLKTGKLFCRCPSETQENNPDYIVERKLRAVAGESGTIDLAAMQAEVRGNIYSYNFYNDSNCLVELDEEPPKQMDAESLSTALQMSLLLDSRIVDELHVMRKTVIDGSNTTGFQRTSLVATGGVLKIEDREIRIQTICLEEDSARIVGREDGKVSYNLDRLGVPLIEIATDPDIRSPDEAREVAKIIGGMLRATEKVKRGIGTIRQDLNISIKNGTRIEIKGVQELNLIPKYAVSEIRRQTSLLEIKEELSKVKISAGKPINLSKALAKTESKILRTAIDAGGAVFGARLSGFAGILGREIQEGRRFGTELSEYAKAYGARGLFHSDELPAYGISESEVEKIRKELRVGEKDAFILIADEEENCRKCISIASDRALIAAKEIPGETRKALPDGNSSYMRPIASSARMYPETDLSPELIQKSLLSEIRKSLPKMPREYVKELRKKYGLSQNLAEKMQRSDFLKMFERLTKETKADPVIIASTFTNAVKLLDEEFILQEQHYMELFNALSEGNFSKEAVPKILEEWSKNPDKNLEAIVKKTGIKAISEQDLKKLIKEIVTQKKELIKEQKGRALQPLMGLVMKEVRGKADGKIIMKILKEEIERVDRKA
ncbi:TPA: Glu-tRNA(Gln) amidotransferase subunit GatE [archaeon]|jgi:glutamyl-tRNA(Gln) amidotransferase subunit E|uniref:Glutamyl-tRNA(Gln) amidotransferase subunit E n=1 Tax=Candidatus Undinarchaeum marinum TaxID=2756141 RepID=A0A832X5D3_9ARCH|nr:Glu-tRNA(Gln) amidotransferase subunit GatE [Candidatus Undinarchaeum marinum]